MQNTTFILIIVILSAVLGFQGCSEPRRDYRKAPPPELSTVLDMHGRWIDLDLAVETAATDAGMAVLSSDNWQTMVQYELVTETGLPASLVVTGIRENENVKAESGVSNINDHEKPGIRRAEARVGRLRDGALELRLLKALEKHLNNPEN